MPERRRMSRRVAGILVVAVGLAAMIVGVKVGFFRAGGGDSRSTATAAAAIHETSSLADLTQGLRAGNPRALVFIQQHLPPPSEAPQVALGDAEAGEWLEALSGLRTGFVAFKSPARAIAVSLSFRIFDRFAVEPAPARWGEALQPVHDLLTAGLADSDPNVRRRGPGRDRQDLGLAPRPFAHSGSKSLRWQAGRKVSTGRSSGASAIAIRGPWSRRSRAWAPCRSTTPPPWRSPMSRTRTPTSGNKP